MPLKDRLLANAEWQGSCLVWRGRRDRFGYGDIWHEGKHRRAHVCAYEAHHGPVPAGMVVMHSCDNPPCINPAHLSAGTRKANSEDMVAKDRGNHVEGSDHPLVKLTAEQVAEIKRRFKPYDRRNGSCALAREFGVHQSTIHAAISGKTWKKPK